MQPIGDTPVLFCLRLGVTYLTPLQRAVVSSLQLQNAHWKARCVHSRAPWGLHNVVGYRDLEALGLSTPNPSTARLYTVAGTRHRPQHVKSPLRKPIVHQERATAAS